MIDIEFRCPRDRRTMFGKLTYYADATSPGTLTGYEPVIQFSCSECRRLLAKRGLTVGRVLHSYTLDGALLRTDHEPSRRP